MAEQPIITEVDASPETVNAVRADVPVGMAGQAIDRAPFNAQLAFKVQSGQYTAKIAGTDRCIRIVDIPMKGGEIAKYHCSRACVGVGISGQRACPEHDKELFMPAQTPVAKGRVINSASVPLTKGESDHLATQSKSFAERGDTSADKPTAARAPVQSATPEPVTLADKTGPEPHHDVKIYFTLEELSSPNLLAVLKERICASLDGLPCNNLRQMKQMVAIQEKLAKTLAKSGRKRNDTGRTETVRGTEG